MIHFAFEASDGRTEEAAPILSACIHRQIVAMAEKWPAFEVIRREGASATAATAKTWRRAGLLRSHRKRLSTKPTVWGTASNPGF
jgi:hypothetical protein